MNKEQIIEAIESMTVLELSELVKALEEKFGVSAAAPVAVAAAPAAGGAAARRLRHADAGGGNIGHTDRKCRRAEHGNSRLVGAERGGRQLLFSARPNGVL